MASTLKLELAADGQLGFYGDLCNGLLDIDGVLGFAVDVRTASSASAPTVTITYAASRPTCLAIAQYFGFADWASLLDDWSDAELNIEK